jgi:hypothetical protein
LFAGLRNGLDLLETAGTIDAVNLTCQTPTGEGDIAFNQLRWFRPNNATDALSLSVKEFDLNKPYLPSSSPYDTALFSALGSRLEGDLSLTLPQGLKSVTARLNLILKAKGTLQAAVTGPGHFFQSLAQGKINFQAAFAGVGPGEIDYEDKGLVPAFFAALKSETGSANVAEDFLAHNFSPAAWAFLADAKTLRAEISLFLNAPKSLTVKWSPPPDYPLSSLQKLAKATPSIPLVNILTLSPEEANALAQQYAPVVFNDLNLAIVVNGRAPFLIQATQPEPGS